MDPEMSIEKRLAQLEIAVQVASAERRAATALLRALLQLLPAGANARMAAATRAYDAMCAELEEDGTWPECAQIAREFFDELQRDLMRDRTDPQQRPIDAHCGAEGKPRDPASDPAGSIHTSPEQEKKSPSEPGDPDGGTC